MKLLNKPSTTFYREVNAGIIPSELAEGRERGRKFPKEAIDAYMEMLQHRDREHLKFVPSSNSDLWARVQHCKKIYGENAVTYRKVLQWKEANKHIFMSVKANDRFVGGVTLMPLAETTIHALINNKILENSEIRCFGLVLRIIYSLLISFNARENVCIENLNMELRKLGF